MNTGLLLEVMVAAFVLLGILALFSLAYFPLTTLLLNERETRRILTLLVKSDEVMGDISLYEMGIRLPNLVDCSRISCEGDLYLRCGPYTCGDPRGKLIVRRMVVYEGNAVPLEVGIP